MLLDTVETRVKESKSPLSFETEGRWDRFLALDGKRAFHIGNTCDTCAFLFQRMEGANQSINSHEVVEALNSGLRSLEPTFLAKLQQILPVGEYRVLLSSVTPTLVMPGDEHDYFAHEQLELWGIDSFWGLPHFPKTEYYRLATHRFGVGRGLYEFLIPMFPHSWLKDERVQEYRAVAHSDQAPTAVSISVLDVKGPATWKGEPEPGSIAEHWCLAHYLVDGHHKVYAAASTRGSVNLISFLAIGKGVSERWAVGELISVLEKV